MNSPAPNPYAPPAAHVEDVIQAQSDAEAIRTEHIKHEASIRSVGLLYYIGGGALIITGASLVIGLGANNPFYVAGPIYVVIGVLTLVVAYGLRTLRTWARLTSIVFAAVGLIGFPVGTIVNAYVLWLLLSKKGRRIFEDDYAGIVAATPHVKYRTSAVVWVILGIVILGIVAAIVIPMMGR